MWPIVSLKDVVVPVKRFEMPVPGNSYRQVGVRLWGEGAYERESIDGSQTRYNTLSKVEKDDIIVNKIWARNGSVAVVSEALSGCYASSEFPIFSSLRDKLEPKWFHWITKTKNFWQQCDEKSQGTSGKNRIRPDQFLAVSIPLPPLPEQRRIVARIEELTGKIEEARELRQQVIKEKDVIIDATINNLFSRITSRSKIKDVADVNYGEGLRKQERNETGTYDVYGSGGLIGKHDKCLTTVPFVVIGRKGSAGEVSFSPNGGWVIDTAYYAMPRDSNALLPRFFFYALKAIDLKTETITTAIPGINRESIYMKEIRLPSPTEQRRIVSYLDNLQSKVDELKKLQTETQKELDALMPSILDKTFKGKLFG